MNDETTKPSASRIGTLELALELKDLPAVLAGLEQIKVAAQEAADAVESIALGVANPLIVEQRRTNELLERLIESQSQMSVIESRKSFQPLC